MLSESTRQRFSALDRLYGAGSLARLRAAHVCVVGIGGVGSWTVEALARSGVGSLTLIDLDEVCITNVNRQLHALDGQIGRTKVASMAERVSLIDPECRVTQEAVFFTPANASDLLARGYDGVVDAIDSVPHKCHLIAACRERGLPVAVAGGAGGKRNPTLLRIDDLSRATHDPLLKKVRQHLREKHGFPAPDAGEFGVPSVFSSEKPVFPWADGTVCGTAEPGSPLRLNCESGFGTAGFVTGAFGLALAAEAVKMILGSAADS